MTSLSRRHVCGLLLYGALPRSIASNPLVPGARPLLIALLSTGHNDSATYESLETHLRESLVSIAPQLQITRREAGFSSELLASQTEEVIASRPNVIICLDLAAAITTSARRRGTNPPIVFLAHDDPLTYKLIQSYARPGNNLTGVTTFRCVDGKMIEILVDAFPSRRRIGYLFDSTAGDSRCIQKAEEAAARLRVDLVKVDVAVHDFVKKMEITLKPLHLEAAIAPASAPIWQNRHAVVERLNDLRLPVIYESALFLDEGGLMYYGPLRTDAISQVAAYVRKILLGEPAGEIPVEQPTLFELAINLRAPHATEFGISAATLRRADRILQ
jgi:putative tryptophan/tyrosine transport system substrate-binding protein